MKNKIKILTYIFFAINNLSCQEKKDVSKNIQSTISMNNKITEKVLKKQLEEGAGKSIDEAGAELKKIPFETEELDASVEVIKNSLKSNGFKELSNIEFNEKIKNIFGRIVDGNSKNKLLYVNYLDKCDRQIVFYPNNGIDNYGTYIIKEKNFITDFYYLPEILDYQKDYPNLNNIESKKIIRYTSTDNAEVEIPHWKDIEDLKEQRKKNIQTIVARNMYLLNDNKAYITWLLTQDQNFVKILVKVFGYDKEPKFNEYIINNLNSKPLDNLEDFYNCVAAKNCDGKLVVRTSFLNSYQTIYDNSKNVKDIIILKYLSANIISGETKDSFNDVEKMKILAYLANTYDPLFKHYHLDGQDWGEMTILADYRDFVGELDWQKLKDEYKKNNYYNLPNLKSVIEYADLFDRVGAPD